MIFNVKWYGTTENIPKIENEKISKRAGTAQYTGLLAAIVYGWGFVAPTSALNWITLPGRQRLPHNGDFWAPSIRQNWKRWENQRTESLFIGYKLYPSVGKQDSTCALRLCRARRCLHFSSPIAIPLHRASTVCYSSASCAILKSVATTLLHASSELVAFGEPLRSRSDLRNSLPLGLASRVWRGIERDISL